MEVILLRKSLVLLSALVIPAIAFAFVNYGININSYHSVTNPNNILDLDSDYALATYTSNVVCPAGDFIRNDYAKCSESGSGKYVSGWEIVAFNGTVYNASSIALNAGNFKDGCLWPMCNTNIAVNVFKTSVLNGTSTNWEFVGTVTLAPNTNQTVNLGTSDNIGAVLVGRDGLSSLHSDARLISLVVNN